MLDIRDRRCDVMDSNPKILQFKSQAVTSLRNIIVIGIIIVIDFDPRQYSVFQTALERIRALTLHCTHVHHLRATVEPYLQSVHGEGVTLYTLCGTRCIN